MLTRADYVMGLPTQLATQSVVKGGPAGPAPGYRDFRIIQKKKMHVFSHIYKKFSERARNKIVCVCV